MKLGAAIAVTLATVALAASATGAPARVQPAGDRRDVDGHVEEHGRRLDGPAKIVATSLAGNTKLAFTVDLGDALGCADAPAEKARLLTKGSGPGHWNAGGFQIKGASKALGNLTLSYVAATGSLTGSGANPPCAIGSAWSVKGKFAGKTFTGKVTIGSRAAAHRGQRPALKRA